MNEWGRIVLGFRGLRTASVFSQFLLSSCKWSFTLVVAVSLSQPGDETGEAMSVRQAWAVWDPPGGSYYLNYWEQSAETHLTTDLSISTRSAFLSLFKTRKY